MTRDVQQGLPAVGAVTEVTASPAIPQVAYARFRTETAVVDAGQLFGTSDAGGAWTNRTGTGLRTANGLAVDPVGQTGLFGVADALVVQSRDGGATFLRVAGDPGGPVQQLAAAPGAGGLRLGALRPGVPAVAVSADGGSTWRDTALAVVARSSALTPLRPVIAVSDGQCLLLVDASAPTPVDRTPGTGLAPLGLTLSAPAGTGFSVVGLREGVVLRAAIDNGLPGAVGQFPSTLLPVSLAVTLPPGGVRRVPYDLLVPRTPTPVDLMFLVDSTGSMSSVIEALRVELKNIVKALNQAGLSIQFGVGNFRDYPDPYGAGSPGDWPYRRNRAIGPVDRELQDAINAIRTGGGTTNGGASPLTAVFQAVTGLGDSHPEEVFVGPGQGAEFRPEALKLTMVAAINRTPVDDLKRLATGSRSFAPDGGVDGNGDGLVDVPAAAPLVCELGATIDGGVVTVNGLGNPAGDGGGQGPDRRVPRPGRVDPAEPAAGSRQGQRPHRATGHECLGVRRSGGPAHLHRRRSGPPAPDVRGATWRLTLSTPYPPRHRPVTRPTPSHPEEP